MSAATRIVVTVIVAAVCVVAMVPTPAFAVVEVSEYRERIGVARSAVEAYIASGAEEGGGGVAVAVLTALPSIERVRVGQADVVVDNSILRTLVARIDVSRDPERRLAIAHDMADHLASIERSLPADADTPPPSDPDALARLLADSRAQVRSPVSELLGQLIERLGEAFQRWQASLSGSSAAARTWSLVVGALIVSLVVVLLVVVYRVVSRMIRTTARRGPVIAGPIEGAHAVVVHEAGLPADIEGYAESLASQGRFTEAVRALFGGAARLLAEHGHVTRTRTRTNTELVVEVEQALPAAAGLLGALASTFERAYYGHVDPGEEGYRKARAAYASLLAVATGPVGDGERS